MFVVYNKDTTRYLRTQRAGRCQDAKFETESAAKAALTREVKRGRIQRDDYDVAEYSLFQNTVEKTVTVTNLMSGLPVVQRVNTPRCCDVSSELYWSM
jgi:hypothetical protein